MVEATSTKKCEAGVVVVVVVVVVVGCWWWWFFFWKIMEKVCDFKEIDFLKGVKLLRYSLGKGYIQ